jgi:hypothetical protein
MTAFISIMVLSPITAPTLMTAPIMMTAPSPIFTMSLTIAPGSILALYFVKSANGNAEFRAETCT